MHICPHCSAPARYRNSWIATHQRPYVCPNCSGKSWYQQPFGLGILTAVIVAGSVYLTNRYFPEPQATVALLVTLAVFLLLQLGVSWRFGQLLPIAGATPEART